MKERQTPKIRPINLKISKFPDDTVELQRPTLKIINIIQPTPKQNKKHVKSKAITLRNPLSEN
jgi:hypothetical protein